MTLGDRIKELRNERNLKQIDLAEALNFSQTTIANYEQNTREPSLKTLLEMSSYFNVTVDYLLGKSNNKLDEISAIDYTINSFVEVLEKVTYYKDPFIINHCTEVAQLSCLIGKRMNLSKKQIKTLNIAGKIHDIGKITIPGEILYKPDRVDKLEHMLIKKHPETGYNIVKDINLNLPVADIILQHHEREDGSGYPLGLTGDNILLEAKIIGVSDVLSAMTSRRPHRPSFSLEEALEEISTNRGENYDPQVVEACLLLFKEDRYQFKNTLLK